MNQDLLMRYKERLMYFRFVFRKYCIMENSNSNDQLAEYKEKLCAEAENLLANIIPDKVKEIQVR